MLQIVIILSVSKIMRQATHIICRNGLIESVSQLLKWALASFDMEHYIQLGRIAYLVFLLL